MDENVNQLKHFYINNAQVGVGVFDFQVTFGTISNKDEISDEFKVIMSPQHAKALLGILNDAINKYESTFGSINIVEIKKDDKKEVALTMDK